MDDCVKLLRGIANDLEIKEYTFRGMKSDPFLNWNIISVSEAFEKYSEIKLRIIWTIQPPFPPQSRPRESGWRRATGGTICSSG
jgi:hypothetical protein